MRVLAALLLCMSLAPAATAQVTSADMGSGAAFFDCDDDGDLDVVYLTPAGEAFLMRNDGDGTFTDVSEAAIPAGIRIATNPGLGVIAGDVNNDGSTDLYFTYNGPNALLLNDGSGVFRGAAGVAGVKGGQHLSASAAFLDYDRDGLLDLYVCNYMGAPNYLFHCEGVDDDGVPHYRNVASELGVDLAGNGQSNWSLGVTVFDYDNDGDTDLYVANDYNDIDGLGGLSDGDNILYRNDGDGTFTDVTHEAGAGDKGWAMGVAHGDFDNDGWIDIYIANFWEDVLYRNNGDGTFTNVAGFRGLEKGWQNNGWGTAFMDYDNDGDLDIHVANGFIPNDQGQVDDEPDQLFENLGEGGGWNFVERSSDAGIDQTGDSRGAAYGDFNDDGYVDILVLNNDYLTGAGQDADIPERCLFVNYGDGTFWDKANSLGFRSNTADGVKMPPYKDTSGNRWVQVRPRGVISNRSAIGARITVRADGRTWIRDVGGSSYCSQNAPWEHFGLGPVDAVDEVTVRFPSGITVTVDDVPLDAKITVLEDAVPVRLLSFGVADTPEGVEVRWQWSDDGEGPRFRVTRTVDGEATVVAEAVEATGGHGRVLDREAPRGVTLRYRLEAVFRDGTRETLHEEAWRRPSAVLGAAYPNPFRSSTFLPVPSEEPSRLVVYDAAGRRVRLLSVPGGQGGVHWDGRDDHGARVPPGAYFYARAGGRAGGRVVVLP